MATRPNTALVIAIDDTLKVDAGLAPEREGFRQPVRPACEVRLCVAQCYVVSVEADERSVVTAARRLARAIEPIAGQTQFSPECHDDYARLGFGPRIDCLDQRRTFSRRSRTARGSLLGSEQGPGVVRQPRLGRVEHLPAGQHRLFDGVRCAVLGSSITSRRAWRCETVASRPASPGLRLRSWCLRVGPGERSDPSQLDCDADAGKVEHCYLVDERP